MAGLPDNKIFYDSNSDSTWMVILNGGRGTPLFLSDDDGSALLFKDSGEAMEAGNRHMLGSTRGFIIVPWEYYEGIL